MYETITTTAGSLKMLTSTDCVKDRLSAYFHWNDAQALEQAVLVAKERHINIDDVKHWAKAEGYSDKLQHFLHRMEKNLIRESLFRN